MYVGNICWIFCACSNGTLSCYLIHLELGLPLLGLARHPNLLQKKGGSWVGHCLTWLRLERARACVWAQLRWSPEHVHDFPILDFNGQAIRIYRIDLSSGAQLKFLARTGMSHILQRWSMKIMPVPSHEFCKSYAEKLHIHHFLRNPENCKWPTFWDL